MHDLTPGILDLLDRLAPASPVASASAVGSPPPTPELPTRPADGDDASTAELTPPVPPATPPTGRGAIIDGLLALPLDRFAEAGECLEVRVPWAPEPLWFVPTDADAEDLPREGIHRGRIWTAAELRDLLAIPGITKAQARRIAETKLAFAGDLVAVEPRAPGDEPAGMLAEPAAPLSWSAWPAMVPGLGPKRVGPFTSCGGCGTGTWIVYGEAARCRPCATDALSAPPTCGETGR